MIVGIGIYCSEITFSRCRSPHLLSHSNTLTSTIWCYSLQLTGRRANNRLAYSTILTGKFYIYDPIKPMTFVCLPPQTKDQRSKTLLLPAILSFYWLHSFGNRPRTAGCSKFPNFSAPNTGTPPRKSRQYLTKTFFYELVYGSFKNSSCFFPEFLHNWNFFKVCFRNSYCIPLENSVGILPGVSPGTPSVIMPEIQKGNSSTIVFPRFIQECILRFN